MTSYRSFKRFVVVGVTSSGKSTLARQVAKGLSLNFVELDAIHWRANWTPATLEQFRAGVTEATHLEGWVVAGNYHVVRDLIWPRAQAIIWLDYPFHVVFWRLLARTIRRGISVMNSSVASTLWPGESGTGV